MAYEMQWTERDLLMQMNTEYRETTQELINENKLLRETAEELFRVMENIDFSAQEMFKYEDMPWDKWEDVINRKPIQLKLF